MSNKEYSALNPIDRSIRALSPSRGMTRMRGEPQVRITLIRGFELFNTRPYHNYETWSDGYRLELINECGEVFYTCEAEDLDEVVERAKRENGVNNE